MKNILEVCYSEKNKQYLDIHLPETDSFPVFVYFHGGGLECGDKSCEQAFCSFLASHGIAVVTANYRMYPDAKYPDFLVDAAEVVSWTFKNMPQYGNIKGIYVGGSSAGGYISQMLCFDSRWLKVHGISAMDINGFVHDAGQPTCHFNVLRERGIDGRRVIIDDSAPIYHIGEDKEYPQMLVIVSDDDMQNRYEQTVLLVSTLKHFGHTENVGLKVMNGTHCSYIHAIDQNGDNVFGKVVKEFILGE